MNVDPPSIEIQREELAKFLKQSISADTPDEVIEKEYKRYLGRILSKNISENLEVISQNPNDYFREIVQTNPVIFSLFNFYEQKQSEIYEIIRNNDPSVLIESEPTVPRASLINIFSDESTYNKDRICLKTKQDIPCVNLDSKVESYISQCKKDWNRSQYFSSKYNTYFVNLPNKSYVNSSPDTNKLFLITIDAINNYFMNDSFYPGLQIDNTEQIDENIGEISCDCEKLSDNHLICASFYSLQIPNDKVKKILYNLSAFDQNPKHAILDMFSSGIYKTYIAKYQNIISNVGEGINLTYAINTVISGNYFDSKNKAFISINQLMLVVEPPISGYGLPPPFEMFSIPLYNIIKINPFEMSDYYYTFLYIINDPPSIVGKWFERLSTTPLTSDFYQFLENKIKMYMDIVIKRPGDFINSTYKGADYMSFINKQAEEFKNTHKPYKYTYKSPKFVPPEKTPLTSSRLLGGKTRRRHKKKSRKLKHVKRTTHRKSKRRLKKKRSIKYKI